MAKQNLISHALLNGWSWSTNVNSHGYDTSSLIAELSPLCG